MKRTYKILTQEAASRYQQEEGALAELDLSREEDRAQVAAGWVERAAADLDAKTRDELDELAVSLGIEPAGFKTKQDLIDEIEKKEV